MYAIRSLKLYLSNRGYALLVPLYILAILLLVSIAIAVAIGITTGFPLSEGAQRSFGFNQAAIWSIPGFLISSGALAVNRNFAMALAFGSTRRHFWFGTSIGFVLTSLLTGVGALVFLALEKLTNHWFIGARAFDVQLLGNGSYVLAFAVIFCLCLLSMYLGAFFGTVYRAYGPTWTLVTGVAIAFIVVALVFLGLWQWRALMPLIEELRLWSAVIVAAVLALVMAAGSFVVNRAATI